MPPILKILRPRQWIKNFFVFAPYIFALQFNNIGSLRNIIIATLSFTAISGAIYIFNDFMDLESDRAHPTKKLRPLAAGKISVRVASYLLVFLLLASYILCSFLPKPCFFILLAYLIFNIAYSKSLKNYAIIDVLIIATGYVFRVLMGGYAIEVQVSSWIILATFLLALFLAFGKRYSEICLDETLHRPSLKGYSKDLLGKMITVSCASTLICYGIYATDIARKTGKEAFVYSVIFVVFGLFRYLQIIFLNDGGGEPEKILFRDKLFLINLILWLLSSVFILIS